MADLRRIEPTARVHRIAAETFCTVLELNATNDGMSDAGFRDFVLTSLALVEYPRPAPELRPPQSTQSATDIDLQTLR